LVRRNRPTAIACGRSVRHAALRGRRNRPTAISTQQSVRHAALRNRPTAIASERCSAAAPMNASLPRAIRDAIVAHARAEYPNEACGLIVGDAPAADGGQARRFEPTRNKAASPYRYEIQPEDLLQLTIQVDDADEVFWGIVHSHTHTPAVPSPTDVGLAFYPDALYVLVSLSDDELDSATGEPRIRAWRIVGGEVAEVALT
jgi:[CysO sulfur-carrier protein]-S-L-cysteine hydrolase